MQRRAKTLEALLLFLMATVYAYVRVVETQSLINIDMKECLYICFFKNFVFKNTALIFFFQMLYRKRAGKKTKQKNQVRLRGL